MRDIALDTQTHDFTIEDYDLLFVDGREYLSQKVKVVLSTVLGEWYLDTNAGAPYLQDILIKNPDPNRVDAVIKAAILAIDDVEELTAYESDYDSASRRFTVTFEAMTKYGIITLTETL